MPWIQIGAIATAVAAVFAGLAYCRPPDAGRAVSPVVPEASTSAARPPASSAGEPAGAEVTYLADLEPDRGRSALTDLPPALAGEPGYDNSIVVECPTNQTGDQISEVAYETRNRYVTFEATLRPYRDPPDDVLVELQIFSDPQDRDPGVPPGGEPSLVQLPMGQDRSVSATIDKAYYLRLRVVCVKPGGFVILVGASVR
jgi:hypothetical protein